MTLYADAVEAARGVDLPPPGPDLHRLALEAICSRGVPAWLTPYGAVRSVAAYALGATDDAFYADGEVLLKAAVARQTQGSASDRGGSE